MMKAGKGGPGTHAATGVSGSGVASGTCTPAAGVTPGNAAGDNDFGMAGGHGRGPGGMETVGAQVDITVTNGAVTAITNSAGFMQKSMPIVPTASFAVATDTITETLAMGNVLETIVFNHVSGSTYSVASVTRDVIPQGTATTVLRKNEVRV